MHSCQVHRIHRFHRVHRFHRIHVRFDFHFPVFRFVMFHQKTNGTWKTINFLTRLHDNSLADNLTTITSVIQHPSSHILNSCVEHLTDGSREVRNIKLPPLIGKHKSKNCPQAPIGFGAGRPAQRNHRHDCQLHRLITELGHCAY